MVSAAVCATRRAASAAASAATRRVLAAAASVSAFTWSADEVDRAAVALRPGAPRSAQEPSFFTAHEWDTVRMLADIIIPRGGRNRIAIDILKTKIHQLLLESNGS